MNWENVLNSYLVNFTDEFSGFQYYYVCHKAALINTETGKFLAITKNFKLSPNEFEILKDVFVKAHSKLENEKEIYLNKEKYDVVTFDYDKNDLYVRKHLGGGVISCSNYTEAFGVFIIALYDEQLTFQDVDGTPSKQNLNTVIKAVDHARRYIIKCGDEIDKNIEVLADKMFRSKSESEKLTN